MAAAILGLTCADLFPRLNMILPELLLIWSIFLLNFIIAIKHYISPFLKIATPAPEIQKLFSFILLNSSKNFSFQYIGNLQYFSIQTKNPADSSSL